MNFSKFPSGNAPHVAVIGSGISGLSAAWHLSKSMQVTLYESDYRLGGHANTVDFVQGNQRIPVDTGFIVYNERNYPNLVALFDHLNVKTQVSDMSFSASMDGGDFEYSGGGLNGLLGRRRNLTSRRFWLMLSDIMRFYRDAPKQVQSASSAKMTLNDYIIERGYSESFLHDHLLPMGAAIWSTTPAQMREYPLQAFLRFFMSHGLLEITNRPQWRTVKGGSRAYVEALACDYEGNLRTNSKVTDVRRLDGRVYITDHTNHTAAYSHVVLATHATETLKLLSDATAREREVLGAFKYTPNTAVLHQDISFMPNRKRVWSSWNYVSSGEVDADQRLCVTYWMNKLQNIVTDEPLLVTLNPSERIDPSKIIRSIEYEHPLFDMAALSAQAQLPRLQGMQNTYFCGAYFGHGFHEDGLQSGIAVAEMISGMKRPWYLRNPNNRISDVEKMAKAV